MTSQYTYSEARQNLASLLDKVIKEGEVQVRRQDGTVFVIRVEPRQSSPLDVPGVDIELNADEIVEFIKEGRKYSEQA